LCVVSGHEYFLINPEEVLAFKVTATRSILIGKQRLNVPFMTILHDVRVDRTGHTLERDLKAYNALQNDLALRRTPGV
jgi:hypothetical protein